LAVRNSQLPEDRQMWIRIGIHVGDVMVEHEDLFGDGVNVAARLEGLAHRGGICISGSTFDQVKNKLSIAFDDIGAQQVKNMPEPIRAFQIVPGRVAVNDGVALTSLPGLTGIAGLKSYHLGIAGIAVVAILIGGAYFAGWVPIGGVSSHPFDGHWRVTIDSLSGCRDNSPKSFAVNVQQGKIDEQHHPLPKKGSISRNGEYSVKATDRAGNLMNTQVATINGDVGTGSFRGMKPGCTGDVMIVRLD
ncbi:MAG: adenylate/guanylate cyclase domain-containing protein, partial [Gammaproteobacteria bacterium]|nr:adenylate/guanylate cyclase domain-containing protein [Gammaproteobacteria bacterium]